MTASSILFPELLTANKAYLISNVHEPTSKKEKEDFLVSDKGGSEDSEYSQKKDEPMIFWFLLQMLYHKNTEVQDYKTVSQFKVVESMQK